MKPILLYEDSRGPTGRFGLHEFVLACVVDELGPPNGEGARKHFENHRPLKGVGNILKALPKLAEEDRPLVIVADDDRIREHLNLQRDAGLASVKKAILERARRSTGEPRDLQVFLLQRNLETILEALRDCGFVSTALEGALAKKPVERDRAMIAAAKGDRAVRDCVRKKMPSLDALVRHVAVTAAEASRR